MEQAPALSFSESGLNFGRVGFGAECMQAGDFDDLNFGVDTQRGSIDVFGGDSFNADDDLFFLFDGALEIVGGALDLGSPKPDSMA